MGETGEVRPGKEVVSSSMPWEVLMLVRPGGKPIMWLGLALEGILGEVVLVDPMLDMEAREGMESSEKVSERAGEAVLDMRLVSIMDSKASPSSLAVGMAEG